MSQADDSKSRTDKGGIPWSTKASYIGAGVLIGLIAYPFVRKALVKFQPRLDEVFDDLTGKAENLAEKASDLMVRAKQNLAKNEEDHEHAHDA
jgi:hypothetical protein